jgi:hypothetical protein
VIAALAALVLASVGGAVHTVPEDVFHLGVVNTQDTATELSGAVPGLSHVLQVTNTDATTATGSRSTPR